MNRNHTSYSFVIGYLSLIGCHVHGSTWTWINQHGHSGQWPWHPSISLSDNLKFYANTPWCVEIGISIYRRVDLCETGFMKYFPALLLVIACGCRPQSDGVSQGPDARTSAAPVVAPIDVANITTLNDLSGNPLQAIDPQAKASVLVFVLPDCPIANSYIPLLNRLNESFRSRGVQMIVVESDPQITLEQASKHAQEYQIGLPVVIDSVHQWVRLAGATRTPEAVVFSPGGDILYRGRIDDQYVGFGKRRMQVTTHDLQDALEAILADRPVPHAAAEAIGCYIPEVPTKTK
jgi:hypothetical protein